jgi:hypothetical protein
LPHTPKNQKILFYGSACLLLPLPLTGTAASANSEWQPECAQQLLSSSSSISPAAQLAALMRHAAVHVVDDQEEEEWGQVMRETYEMC